MEKLKISTSLELVMVPTEDIAFIKASGNYSDIYLFNGKVMTMTFQLHFFVEALARLKEKKFVRVGKSLLVNKDFIYSININSQDLLLMDHRLTTDFKLRASKDALKELKTILEQEGDNK
jgi:DNA-binding LytR/AlgR family response regulator